MTGTAEVAVASDHCLRWRDGMHSWPRTRDGGFDPADYTVAPVDEAAAKAFVTSHHYSRSYPAASRRFALTERAGRRLVGVAVFGVPVQKAVLALAFPTLQPYTQSLELSRFVLLDRVPGNAESWFLARCFAALLDSSSVRGVVSFADPMPRRTLAGTVVAPGHVGAIYQASNAVYAGRGTARTLVLLPDGTVLNSRSAQKVRRQEQGHEYVERLLVCHGARVPTVGQDMTGWLAASLDDVGARRLRHRGPHRYLFPLGSSARARARIGVGHANPSVYPKLTDAA